MDSIAPDSELSCPLGDSQCQYLRDLQNLRAEVALLKEQVRTDALTGLYNFRFFSDALPLEMERSRRSLQPLSLIVLDIDHFKVFNDTWGHELGNQVLKLIANLISLAIRKLDYACRFGGEEFVILLPNTDLRQARNVAERLREAIQSTPLNHNGSTLPVTASLGVDEFRAHHSDTPEGFVERVDAWLYEAKREGRNCVKCASIEPLPVQSTVTPGEKDALFNLFRDDD